MSRLGIYPYQTNPLHFTAECLCHFAYLVRFANGLTTQCIAFLPDSLFLLVVGFSLRDVLLKGGDLHLGQERQSNAFKALSSLFRASLPSWNRVINNPDRYRARRSPASACEFLGQLPGQRESCVAKKCEKPV